MSSSTTARLGSQNNSRCPSSSRTSTAACSELPQHLWIVPYIPANSDFQCPSLTFTTVPLRASYASKMFISLLGWGLTQTSGPNQAQEPKGNLTIFPFPGEESSIAPHIFRIQRY